MPKLTCRKLSLLAVFLLGPFWYAAAGENTAQNHLVSGWEFSPGAESKISAADGKEGDDFGTAVAACGSYAYVGSPNDRMNNKAAGSVYAYFMSTEGVWTRVDKIYPSSELAADGDKFGFSVQCSGDMVAVGAPKDSSQLQEGGAAYVYSLTPEGLLELSAKFYSYSAEEYEHFGHSVAVWDDLLLVGAIGSSEAVNDHGIVYAYRKESGRDDDLIDDDDAYDDDLVPKGWIIEALFYPSDVAAFDNFGYSISVSGGLIVVGSPNADARRGAAYVYNRTLMYTEFDDDLYGDDFKNIPSYLFLKRLTGGDGTVKKEFFGVSVAVHKHTIVVGQYMASDDTYVVHRGAAHVFTTHSSGQQLSWWDHVAILIEPVTNPVQNYFGRSVAVHDNTVLVDAPGSRTFSNATVYSFGRYHTDIHTSNANLRHSAYHYLTSSEDYSFWSHQATLVASGRAQQTLEDDLLGSAIAISSDGIGVVGSPAAIGSRGEASGAIFTFRGDPVAGGSSDTDDDPFVGGGYENSGKRGADKNLAWLVILIVPTCVLSYFFYKYNWKRKRKRAGPSTSGREFGQGGGGGYADIGDNSTDISDLDSDMSFREFRGRVKTKLSMLSNHAKGWVGGTIQNPMYLNQAQSDYSVENSDEEMDSSRGSNFGSSMWNFGGRRNAIISPTKSATSKKRGTQQILATARAVANDMSHPNQDEVAVLLRTHEKDWITEEKFMETLEELVY